MPQRNAARAAAAISVAVAVTLAAWWVNGVFVPEMAALGAVAGLCAWYWRLIWP